MDAMVERALARLSAHLPVPLGRIAAAAPHKPLHEST
jgi:hypothetical protein